MSVVRGTSGRLVAIGSFASGCGNEFERLDGFTPHDKRDSLFLFIRIKREQMLFPAVTRQSVS